MLVGEKMPDKDDPKYRQRYEEEVKAGRKFARTLKLDVLAIKVSSLPTITNDCSLPLSLGLSCSVSDSTSTGWSWCTIISSPPKVPRRGRSI